MAKVQRLLAIGDIHGCAKALKRLLAEVDLKKNDLLVTLGDYVDRGPNSKGVIEQLLAIHEQGQLIAIRGNHDWMMCAAREDESIRKDWLSYGGTQALKSYGKNGLADVPATHWKFLDEVCRDYYEHDAHFFVHANVYPDLDLAEQPDYMLLWEKLYPTEFQRHKSGKTMVCGHTPQRQGVPLVKEHVICLDTHAYTLNQGWLTCMDVLSGKIWQAQEIDTSAIKVRKGSVNFDTLEFKGLPKLSADDDIPF